MYKEIFPMRLKEAREKTKLTQRDVGKELKISQSSIAKYETGKSEPDIETLGRLAEFYNVSLDKLFGLVIKE